MVFRFIMMAKNKCDTCTRSTKRASEQAKEEEGKKRTTHTTENIFVHCCLIVCTHRMLRGFAYAAVVAVYCGIKKTKGLYRSRTLPNAEKQTDEKKNKTFAFNACTLLLLM